MVSQRCQLIPSRGIDDQGIIESNYTRGTPGPNQPKRGSLTCYLPLMNIFIQKSTISRIDSFQCYCWSRILQSDWTRHIPGHTQRKVVVLHSTLAGWLSLNKKNKEIKRVFFSDWKRGSPGHTQPKKLVIYYFPMLLPSSKKNQKIWICSLQWCCWSKNPAIWWDERQTCQHPTKSGSLRSYLASMTNSMH